MRAATSGCAERRRRLATAMATGVRQSLQLDAAGTTQTEDAELLGDALAAPGTMRRQDEVEDTGREFAPGAAKDGEMRLHAPWGSRSPNSRGDFSAA